MGKIDNELAGFNDKEKSTIKELLEKIMQRKWPELNKKKLGGNSGAYRVKKGRIRIIFHTPNGKIKILSIGRRSEKTYKGY